MYLVGSRETRARATAEPKQHAVCSVGESRVKDTQRVAPDRDTAREGAGVCRPIQAQVCLRKVYANASIVERTRRGGRRVQAQTDPRATERERRQVRSGGSDANATATRVV